MSREQLEGLRSYTLQINTLERQQAQLKAASGIDAKKAKKLKLLEAKVLLLLIKIDDEYIKALQYVDTLTDPYIRTIIMLRIFDGLTWRQIAQRLGGGNTESSVKMAYFRHFEHAGV